MAAVTYTEAFFDHIADGSVRSAEVVLRDVVVPGDRVVDVGCGTGAWLSVAKQLGCVVHGFDGYAPTDRLLIDGDEFTRADLAGGVDCTGFDLALCLEVAEHLPESAADLLVAGLAKAGRVLFSAAIPGQGGVGHVNERWGSWWAEKFAAHGMVGSCRLRWKHWDDPRIENWYRQNLIEFRRSWAWWEAAWPLVDVVHPERLGIWP